MKTKIQSPHEERFRDFNCAERGEVGGQLKVKGFLLPTVWDDIEAHLVDQHGAGRGPSWSSGLNALRWGHLRFLESAPVQQMSRWDSRQIHIKPQAPQGRYLRPHKGQWTQWSARIPPSAACYVTSTYEIVIHLGRGSLSRFFDEILAFGLRDDIQKCLHCLLIKKRFELKTKSVNHYFPLTVGFLEAYKCWCFQN